MEPDEKPVRKSFGDIISDFVEEEEFSKKSFGSILSNFLDDDDEAEEDSLSVVEPVSPPPSKSEVKRGIGPAESRRRVNRVYSMFEEICGDAYGEVEDEARRREEEARRRAEEAARRKAEEENRRRAEEAARRRAEEEAARARAFEENRRRAEEEAARKRAFEENRRRAEEEAARARAFEENRRRAEEEAARKRAFEENRLRAEEEAARARAFEENRRRAEEEAARKRAFEEACFKAEEEARLKAEEEARLKAEEEARLKAEEEARIKAEEEARRRDEDEAARERAFEENRLKAWEETPDDAEGDAGLESGDSDFGNAEPEQEDAESEYNENGFVKFIRKRPLEKTAAHSFSKRRTELDDELDSFEKAFSEDPDNDAICFHLAGIYAIRGRISDVADSYLELMRIYQESGRYEQALEVAGLVRSVQPENDVVRLNSIAIYRSLKDVDAVVRMSIELSGIYTEIGRGEEAIGVLKRALKDAPSNLTLIMRLADICISLGHISDAASYYGKAAHAFLCKKDFEKALDAFRKVKVLVPNDVKMLLTLGNLYYSLNRLDEAAVEYRKAFTLNLDNVYALMAFGCVCQMKGSMRNALLAFDKILRINTSDMLAIEKIGEVHQSSGNFKEAVGNYLIAASAYEQTDDPEHAARLYRRVLKMDPGNAKAVGELEAMGAPLESGEPDEFRVFEPDWEMLGVRFED